MTLAWLTFVAGEYVSGSVRLSQIVKNNMEKESESFYRPNNQGKISASRTNFDEISDSELLLNLCCAGSPAAEVAYEALNFEPPSEEDDDIQSPDVPSSVCTMLSKPTVINNYIEEN